MTVFTVLYRVHHSDRDHRASFSTPLERAIFVTGVSPYARILEETAEERCCLGNDPACPEHGVAASNARENDFYRRHARG
jgi:hypothetical protein